MNKSKLINNVFKFKNVVLFLAFLIAAAFPMGSMDGVKIESAFKIIFLFVKGAFAKNFENGALFICAMLFLAIGIGHISTLKCYCITKLSKYITRIVCGIVIYLTYIITASINLKFYGLSSGLVVFAVFALIFDLLFITADFIYSRKAQTAEDNATDKQQPSGQETEIQENTSQNVPRKKRSGYMDSIGGLIISAIIFFCLSFYFFVPSKFNNLYNFIDVNYGGVINYQLGESYIGANGVDDEYINNLVSNFEEGRTQVFSYNSSNYQYWQKKIEEKKTEIRQLMPASASQSDLEKYANRVKALQEEIEVINNNLLTLNYENISVTTVLRSETVTEYWGLTTTNYYGDITEIRYDTQYNNGSGSQIKWGNKQNKRLFCGQSITLTQTEFVEGTDFATVKIGATINYYDGSMKKSYVSVSNYSELNNAAKGTHTLEWSDDWGTYEYKITII